jgi:hypothetical protein
MPVILLTDEERDVLMRHRGMKRMRCNDHCRMPRSRLLREAPTRRTARRQQETC